jgi:hypothetical protein
VDPWRDTAGLPAGVCKLNRYLLVLRVSKLDNLLQGLNLRILPETGIFGRDATFRDNSSRFDDRQARTASEDAAN